MESIDNDYKKGNSAKKVAFGLLIIAFGGILLINNLGGLSWYLKSVIFSWPMLIVAIGILNLFGRKSYLSGLIIIMVGVFFLIPLIFPFNFNFTHLFWPVLLIAVGILIIARRGVCPRDFHHPRHHEFKFQTTPEEVSSSGNTIDEVNVFGGSKIRVASQNFRGGKITAIFGGSEIDLTNAKLAEGTNVIDMVCIFGGTGMVIPSDWHVRSEVVSILGGFADKRFGSTGTVTTDRELVIKGIALFGGGEIKSI